ncbi:P-loop containing nucleoside triphosphate hydrolase protein [Penicillium cf. griseofulvum]|uniref:P-loop containing nucleoside triphosphate hydrolase protein n=1 Tax=Penicillium cf. griseofulvum TaxID=2972120 RepID=A0A9W9J0L0_9EURO|nr:P-loop containing nucleoside triphosphate hydrolase protein [Penicillium cf. griseofulvum]KAJ5434189.1 P-loop containing nucleoside triphosphate hydrolase protein [Penicillium cf. griseofulvum]KAJ5452014.1 P-loop containing nucleoside triphosphate hydrolase protein [Penicillium cf. griseofulvum]
MIVLDDPFSAVDARVAQCLWDDCIRNCPKRSSLCDHILVLDKGGIIAQRPPDQVLKRPFFDGSTLLDTSKELSPPINNQAQSVAPAPNTVNSKAIALRKEVRVRGSVDRGL